VAADESKSSNFASQELLLVVGNQSSAASEQLVVTHFFSVLDGDVADARELVVRLGFLRSALAVKSGHEMASAGALLLGRPGKGFKSPAERFISFVQILASDDDTLASRLILSLSLLEIRQVADGCTALEGVPFLRRCSGVGRIR
jgi:hypothetical protein